MKEAIKARVIDVKFMWVLACVASISVEQRTKDGGFRVLPARKMGREQK